MDQQTREAVQVLLQGRQYVLSLLHTLFGTEPAMEMLRAAASDDSLATIALFEAQETPGAAMLREALMPLRQVDEEQLGNIRQEYTNLFLGPRELVAPPWESVYVTRDRALFQESTLAVRQWYQRYGYQPAGYPRYPDDHISLMLHFLALLTGEALGCLREGRVDDCRGLLEGQKVFVQNHLLHWLPRYQADMQKAETALFYPGLSAALCQIITDDGPLIDELLASL
jgi:TorA maturation chaperone TorD